MVERGGSAGTELRRNGSANSTAPMALEEIEKKPLMARASPKLEKVAVGGERAWNTSNLGYRLGSDALAALSAGGLVAPIITVIDR